MSIDLSLLSDAKRRKPFTTLDGAGHRNRMRLRVLRKGAVTLEDYEILEMLLYCVVPRKDTKPLAKHLINHFGSFRGVLSADKNELKKQASFQEFIPLVMFIQQIALRLKRPDGCDRLYLKRWQDILLYLNEYRIDLKKLHGNYLRLLFLNGQQRLIAEEYIVHEDIQSIAIIFRKSIEFYATNLIIVSYITTGFNASIRQKEANFSLVLQSSAVPFGLNICEHVVYVNEQYYSIFKMKK